MATQACLFNQMHFFQSMLKQAHKRKITEFFQTVALDPEVAECATVEKDNMLRAIESMDHHDSHVLVDRMCHKDMVAVMRTLLKSRYF